MSCYSDLDDYPWRCPRPPAYELLLASLASHSMLLCVECCALYRKLWPDDVIEVRTYRPEVGPQLCPVEDCKGGPHSPRR